MTEAELDFAEVRRAFDHAATSYDAHAVLQREVCDRLLERLDFMSLQPGRVLDVGTGTGYGLAHLRARYAASELCALDIAPAMLAAARAPAAADVGAACAASPGAFACGDESSGVRRHGAASAFAQQHGSRLVQPGHTVGARS